MSSACSSVPGNDHVPLIKALHIIAGSGGWLVFFPMRLFVYHACVKPRSKQSETFKVMERRLLNFIMTPAMAVTWILGIVLMLQGQWMTATWFLIKFVMVIAMSIMHGLFSRWVSEFSYDRNRHSQKLYRIVNEIPTVLLIVIVALAVVKPF